MRLNLHANATTPKIRAYIQQSDKSAAELIWRTIFQTRAEARHAIGRYIDGFDNPVRRHSALDFISPVQFEKLAVN